MKQFAVTHPRKGMQIVSAMHEDAAVKKVHSTKRGWHWECHKNKSAIAGIGFPFNIKTDAKVMCENGDVFYCGLGDNG